MNCKKWSLIHFKELRLTKGDLSSVPENSLALFAVTSYAISELNVIARLMLCTFSEREKDDLINSAIFAQEACVLRFWVLKLFEFRECISDLSTGKERASGEVRSLSEAFIKDFQSLKTSGVFPIARSIRNEASAHYKLSAAKKNVRFVKENANATMMIHRSRGNSYYPFGEEVMFAGRLNRHGASLSSTEEKIQLYENLFRWCRDTNKWVYDCHIEVFRKLIQPNLSKRRVQNTTYWVNPEKVGNLNDFSVPVFSAIDQSSKQ